MTSTATLIEARGLTKRYGGFTAVDGIDLTIGAGEVFGFLGPNGSGKSTSILMMLGLTEPTGGTVRVCGYDPTRNPLAVKRQVGYLPESVGFYGDMTGAQNLRFTAELNGIPRAEAGPRIDELLDMVELEDAANQPVAQYSRGMRQRLGLADVLLKQPRLVILDDPTLGLDPAGIVWLLGLIEELSARQGIAVFLSSHQLVEVQRVCNRVGIMSHGKIVLEGTVAALTAQTDSGGFRITLKVEGATAALDTAFAALPSVRESSRSGIDVVIESNEDVRAAAAAAVHEHGARLLEMRANDRTLEDIYLRYFQEDEA
ncbi:MAG: ABC transporter ATP-binding protein [Chloroflexi bacterium]|nr:ABC transporter ATP-binding protein [Chloroflexota bacterium]